MDNGKCFELAVILAVPHIATLDKNERGASQTYQVRAAAEIARYYQIVKEASKIL